MARALARVALAACCVGCAPLLDADFNDFSEGTLSNGTFNLPGSPSGDQMVVSSGGSNITIEDGLFNQRHLRIPTGGSVTFRPVEGSPNSRIFIAYNALITGSSARGRIIFHNLDENGAPDNTPDMTLDFVQADAQIGEAPVTSTGWKMNGIRGEHSVFISISPDGETFIATVAGAEVTNSPNILQFASTDNGWRANPPNFEFTLTLDPEAGAGAYQLDDVLVTEDPP